MLKIAYHPIYQHPLPEGHRFPMLKYELIPRQLLHEGIITYENLFEPKEVEEETILLTHDQSYWHKMKTLQLSEREMRKVGFPLSKQLVERECRIAQGTVDCVTHAKEFGVALNVAGGTHHSFSDRGEGFCLLNDIAIAANFALREKMARSILVIDLDVHQGNGTAQLFANNDSVFTLSMHGKHNYPFHKERSDLDIELEDGTSDETYLSLMQEYIPDIFEKRSPDLVFYLAGVDILSTDKFGKLQISQQGCANRDKLIFEWCKKHKSPVVVSMGGGYSPNIADIVNAHCNTFKLAQDCLVK